MEKIAVLVDTGSQIPMGKYEDEGLFVVPLCITMNDETYLDEVEIHTLEIFKRMQEEDLSIMTSQPSTGELINIMERIKSLGYTRILALPIASGLSSEFNGMMVAADMVDLPIDYIDSKSTAGNQKYLAFKAVELIRKGLPLDDIKKILSQMVIDSGTIILTPNLDHLKKGGRITPAVALLAGMLKIVPVMELNQELGGKIDSLAKVRTLSKARHVLVDRLLEKGVNASDYVITIEHVLCEDSALKLKQLVLDEIGPMDIELKELPAVVGIHMGVGGLGIQYMKKYEVE